MSARLAALRRALVCGTLVVFTEAAFAQAPASPPPPAVGVVAAEFKPMTESTDINGRIQARERVDIVARVTAFMMERNFTEGADIKKGDPLYKLERGPYEADVEAKQAAVAEAEAQLINANLTLSRAQELLQKTAGTQVAVDSALATQRTTAAQVKAAQAQLHLANINLGYTDINSPIDGRIGRTAVTPGNVVGLSSGVLATVVSDDPMYVMFPVAMRRILELRDRYADKGGFDAVVIRLRLPNGKLYDQVGKLDFVDIGVAKDTDTLMLRGTIPNPLMASTVAGTQIRELQDSEFVSVALEAVEPLKVLAIPRGAVLSDQQGDYVYVVGDGNKVEQRRIELGQTTPQIAGITSGIKQGEKVVVEGLQRVRPNAVVTPTVVKPAELKPGNRS
jgi:membrane fusion protein, multidrug efflux system